MDKLLWNIKWLTVAAAWIPGLLFAAEIVPSTVRVAVLRDIPTITLSATSFRCGVPPLGPVETLDPTLLPSATLTATEAGIMLNAHFFLTEHLQCEAVDGTLMVNRSPVHGTLQIYRTTRTGSTAHRLTVVEELPLEEYLLGVMSGEMQATWPQETLRAQAVVARSYVVAKLRETSAASAYDVEATIEDQVYQPNFRAPAAISNAVTATRGEVVMHRGSVLKTYFHSCCGGFTVPADTVWGAAAQQHLPAVRDPYCLRSPHARWNHQLTRTELATRLDAAGFITPHIKGLRLPAGNGRPGAITVMTSGDPLQLSADTFRRTVGYRNLKSTWFTARPYGGGWLLRGRGYGHGVGLCQWGAKTMGDRGKTYQQIVQFYYPGTTVQTLDDQRPVQ